MGGFPEMKTFGYRAKDYLIKNSKYDVVIDNQSISYSMIDIQKNFLLLKLFIIR